MHWGMQVPENLIGFESSQPSISKKRIKNSNILLDKAEALGYNNKADFGTAETWRRNSVGRVAGSYPVCHLFESGRRYQARWSSG